MIKRTIFKDNNIKAYFHSITNEQIAKEIFSKHNADLQRGRHGVLSYNPEGYECIISAMVEYGKLMYDLGKAEEKEDIE